MVFSATDISLVTF